jgi:predicted AAA+ superfamily ATPase
VHYLLTDYHLFTVEDALQSYEDRTLTGTITSDVFEYIEIDDMEMSRLVVESLLTDDIP